MTTFFVTHMALILFSYRSGNALGADVGMSCHRSVQLILLLAVGSVGNSLRLHGRPIMKKNFNKNLNVPAKIKY